MVLALIVKHNVVTHFGGAVIVEDIVRMANTIFLQEQVQYNLKWREICRA